MFYHLHIKVWPLKFAECAGIFMTFAWVNDFSALCQLIFRHLFWRLLKSTKKSSKHGYPRVIPGPEPNFGYELGWVCVWIPWVFSGWVPIKFKILGFFGYYPWVPVRIGYPNFGHPRVIPKPKPKFGYGFGWVRVLIPWVFSGWGPTHKVLNFGFFGVHITLGYPRVLDTKNLRIQG